MKAARCWAVVPAAGAGRRMGGSLPKQFLPLRSRTVLAWALEPLLRCPRVAGVVLAVPPGDARWRDAVGEPAGLLTVEGGSERCDSVLAGLEALAGRSAAEDWVLVHDAARPCLAIGELASLLDSLWNDAVGGLLALPLTDTLKRSDASGRVAETLPRRGLWRALTPQMFRYAALREALRVAAADGDPPTDEAAAMERAGHRPRLVPGRPENLKITGPDDLALAEAVLAAREVPACA
jgi:2-C-methyl-D-erythritol 4-phosphate cytidylyltransferase